MLGERHTGKLTHIKPEVLMGSQPVV